MKLIMENWKRYLSEQVCTNPNSCSISVEPASNKEMQEEIVKSLNAAMERLKTPNQKVYNFNLGQATGGVPPEMLSSLGITLPDLPKSPSEIVVWLKQIQTRSSLYNISCTSTGCFAEKKAQ